MRLFVALNLPKKERDRVYRSSRKLRDGDLPVNWVEPDNFHVTLKFLGEVHPDRVERVEALLANVASATDAFDVQLKGFGAFPTIRRPRVIWLGLDPSPALRCLKQDLEWALATCGFERETRAFHPHLTLGRANEESGGGVFRGLDDTVAAMDYSGGFRVRSLDLMKSQLSKQGPRYTVVSSSHLNTGR